MENPSDCESIENEVKEALQNNDQALAAAKIQEYLDRQNKIPLSIAITGETGAGKSTFVNAFRGIDNKDEKAAPTGCVETTFEATPYPHPNYPNVTLWDLPGIGTTNFPADKYLQRVGFEKFDFFIIISADRFRENDVKLAKEIQRMKKKFYFVRSKIDNDTQNEERSQGEKFNLERTLSQIRENCTQGLQKQGVESPQVFLVSSVDLYLYDFHQLEETLERELPAHKRDAFLFAMPSVSLEIINKKKEAFQEQIKWIALGSAAGAAVPLPGLSLAVDVTLLVDAAKQYIVGFGLDSRSLQRLADTTHVPLKDLTDLIVSPLALTKITPDLVIKLSCQCGISAALIAAEEVTRLIPILGIPLAMTFSFTSTYKILNAFLNMLAEDAQRVFKRALGLNTSV